MTVPAPPHRTPLLRTTLVWLAGNLFIGLCAIYPIGVFDTLTYYLRAVDGEDVVAPYGSDGAKFAVVEIVVMGALVLAAAVLLNRRQWRRFRAVRPTEPLPLLAATAAALALPFLWFWFGTDRSF